MHRWAKPSDRRAASRQRPPGDALGRRSALVGSLLLLTALGLPGCTASNEAESTRPTVGPAPTSTSSSGSSQPDRKAQEPTPAPDLRSRTLKSQRLSELSGLAASRLHDGVLFGINDSGGAAEVYAIDPDGAISATLRLPGVSAFDWEALAPGWDNNGDPVLWIGDIGDNLGQRSAISLYRIPEPAELVDQDVPFERFDLTYPDGAKDAEGLLVHPVTGRVLVITKTSPGLAYGPSEQLRADRATPLQRVAEMPGGTTDAAFELGANRPPRIVLVGYLQVLAADGIGGPWRSDLGPLQRQREAVAWPWFGANAVGSQVYVGSEGAGSTVLPADVPD